MTLIKCIKKQKQREVICTSCVCVLLASIHDTYAGGQVASKAQEVQNVKTHLSRPAVDVDIVFKPIE